MEERIIELEKRAAFQENEIEGLKEALHEAHKRLEHFAEKLKVIESKASDDTMFVKPEDEERPPHY